MLPPPPYCVEAILTPPKCGNGAVAPLGPVTPVRLNMYPDGGVSRLRLFGRHS